MGRWRLLLFLPLLWDCDCQGENVLGKVQPSLRYEPTEIDFGEVPLGATKRSYVRISNEGSADLVLSAPEAMSPFFASIDNTTVKPGAQALIDVGFRPSNDEAQAGQLIFSSNDEAQPQVSIALRGQGVAGSMTLRPPAVDFRNTVVGVERSAELVLDNLGIGPVAGRIVGEGFGRPEHWSLSTLTTIDQAVPFGLEARSQAVYEFRYRPIAAGEDPGVIRFEICGDRCGLEVEVLASSSQASVVLEPPGLDFGAQGIGETRTQQIVVHNLGTEPVEVQELRKAGGSEWAAVAPRGLPFTLAAGDSAAINVSFTPDQAAETTAEILVLNSDPTSPVLRAGLTGHGAGPRFEVVPNPISFGVQRAAGSYRRTVLTLNSGSSEVQVQAVSLSGDAVFGLAPLPGLPARLASGESLSLEVIFTPAELGEYRGTLSISTNDSASTLVEIPITGGMAQSSCEISSAPERLNFGALPAGYSRRLSAQITNVGQTDCNFLSGSFRAPVDPAFSLLSTPWPVVITPGQSLTVDVEYAPTQAVDAKGNLTLLTDDLVFPERHVSLLGTARQDTRVFVQPPFLDFGDVAVNCAANTQSTTLFNLGTTRVNVAAVNVNIGSEFQVFLPAGLPSSVEAGATFPIRVDYRPVNPGIDSGTIEIIVPEVPYAFVVPLTGRGLIDETTSDTFSQIRNNKVDVLFVVDDSCSMADDQAALAANFGDFIHQASLRSVDFQIGVTTTTVLPTGGQLVGPVLTSQTPRLEAAFGAQVNVGINGSGVEQGLEGMAGALNLADQGVLPNSQLIRRGAGLVVVLVSDEDDQSPASPSFYYGELHRRYGADFTVAAVTGEAAGCFDPMGGSAAAAPRYLDFLTLSGGLSESICADWANTLTSLGDAVFGLRAVFPLSSAADASAPIVVTVDGVPVPASEWSYDASRRAVVFQTPPADGTTVVIVYKPTC